MTHPASPNGIQAVLFDMDGLIVDTEPIHFEAFRRYLLRFGVELPESVMPDFIGYTEEDNLRDLKAKYGLDEPVGTMVAERRAIYLELVRTLPLTVFPGFWEFTAEARRRGLKQAIVSSASRDQIAIVLGRLFEAKPELGRPEAYFGAVVSGDDVSRSKPAPDIYLEGARRLDVPPARCLAIEDSPPGAEAAAAAGMIVLAVPNGYTAGLPFPGAGQIAGSLDDARRALGW